MIRKSILELKKAISELAEFAKQAQELGYVRTVVGTSVHWVCPACRKSLPSLREVRKHMPRHHHRKGKK